MDTKELFKKNASYILSLVIGSGFIWNLWSTRIAEKTQISEYARVIIDLYAKESVANLEIHNLTTEYIKLKEDTDKPDLPAMELYHGKLQLEAIHSQIEMKRQEFQKIEEQLSRLEGRKVRDMNLNFFPPEAPSNMTMSVHQ